MKSIIKDFFTKFGERSYAKSVDADVTQEKYIEPSLLSPLVLAYIGDSVYEMFVRVTLVSNVDSSVHKLHTEATEYVRCESQADVIRNIYDMLSEKERSIVKRGRNAHSGYVPKNADVVEYRYATGFESLLGYLYMSREFDRLDYILDLALKRVTERKGNEKLTGGRTFTRL